MKSFRLRQYTTCAFILPESASSQFLGSQAPAVARNTFYQRKLIYQQYSFQEAGDVATVSCAPITSRIDYCNVL